MFNLKLLELNSLMKRFLVSLIAFATFTSSANAGQTKWVKSVSVQKNGYGFFIGKCNFFGGCPEGKPIYGSISIGQNIQGLEIGAIQCEKFNRTIEGWRGGPNLFLLREMELQRKY